MPTHTYALPMYADDPTATAGPQEDLLYVASTGKIWEGARNYGPTGNQGGFAIIDPATLTVNGYTTGETFASDTLQIAFYNAINDSVWSVVSDTTLRIIKHSAAGVQQFNAAYNGGGSFYDDPQLRIWQNLVNGEVYVCAAKKLRRVNLTTGADTDVAIDLTDGTNEVGVYDVVSDAGGLIWFVVNTWTAAFAAFVSSEIYHFDTSTDTGSVVWSTTTAADRAERLICAGGTVIVWQKHFSAEGHVLPLDVATGSAGTAIALTGGTRDSPLYWRYDSGRDRVWSYELAGGTGETAADPMLNAASIVPATFAIETRYPVLFEPTSADNTNPANYDQSFDWTGRLTVLWEIPGKLVWSAWYYLFRASDSLEIDTAFIGAVALATTELPRQYVINGPGQFPRMSR